MPTELRLPMERTSSLGYQVNHLARLLAQALRVRIEPHGVIPGQFAQLLALYEEDGLTQSELCERVRIDQSTMAHTLKRMERDGLIARKPDPVDRRRAIITTTARARSLQPSLVAAATDVNAIAVHGLGPQEAAEFMTVIARIIDNLQADSSVDQGE